MMSLIKAELYKSIIILKRNYFRFFDITVWPIILFFAIVLFLKFVSPTPEIMSMVITGLIGWRAVYHFQIESNINYMEDYWSKNTAQQLASPLRIRDILYAGVFAGTVKFLIVLAIYLVLAFTLFSFEIVSYPKFIIGVIYLCFVGFILGMITFSFVILYKDKAITFSFMIPDLVVLLSGVYFPIAIFPDAIITFVHILPTFYGFELLKSMTGLGTANYLGMIVVSLVWFIGALVILRYAIKKARQNGSLCNFN